MISVDILTQLDSGIRRFFRLLPRSPQFGASVRPRREQRKRRPAARREMRRRLHASVLCRAARGDHTDRISRRPASGSHHSLSSILSISLPPQRTCGDSHPSFRAQPACEQGQIRFKTDAPAHRIVISGACLHCQSDEARRRIDALAQRMPRHQPSGEHAGKQVARRKSFIVVMNL